MFSGAEVLGKNIKLESGKTASVSVNHYFAITKN